MFLRQILKTFHGDGTTYEGLWIDQSASVLMAMIMDGFWWLPYAMEEWLQIWIMINNFLVNIGIIDSIAQWQQQMCLNVSCGGVAAELIF
ncbi:hypothetical protein OROMI_031082 [Orobanche minor]